MTEAYYQDDHATIYHGDCLEITEWVAGDVMVTDPPYGIGWRRSLNKARGSRAHNGIAGDNDTRLRDACLTAWNGKPAAVFGSLTLPPPKQTRQVLIWHKPADAGVVGSLFGYRRDAEAIYILGPWPRRNASRSSIIRSTVSHVGGSYTASPHPHEKPTDIIRHLIETIGDGVVVDPFMGSGTTLRAAKDLGRKAIGIEIDERYCEIAARRLAQEVLPL